jgi:predicted oxidoreductase
VTRTLTPLTRGPFYGAEVAPGDVGTCGGLRVNGRAQVIDVFDRPIARLYASGNTSCVGSPGALYGGGGGTLGPAMTFAYIAANELVKLTPVKT